MAPYYQISISCFLEDIDPISKISSIYSTDRRAFLVPAFPNKIKIDVKASPLTLAPLAIAGFLVAGLVAWQYSDRLGHCWLAGFLLFGVCFAGSLYCNVRKFLDASFHVICVALAVASLQVSLQLLTIAHRDQFDGFLRSCFFVVRFLFYYIFC